MPTALGTPNLGAHSPNLSRDFVPQASLETPSLYLGQGAAGLLCVGPLEQKKGVQGGRCTKEKQLGSGSLAQEGLHFHGEMGDSPCPLCRGDPGPLSGCC